MVPGTKVYRVGFLTQKRKEKKILTTMSSTRQIFICNPEHDNCEKVNEKNSILARCFQPLSKKNTLAADTDALLYGKGKKNKMIQSQCLEGYRCPL